MQVQDGVELIMVVYFAAQMPGGKLINRIILEGCFWFRLF